MTFLSMGCRMSGLFVVVFSVLLISCSSTRKGDAEKDSKDQDRQQRLAPLLPGGEQVPPGHCRVRGTVVRIDSLVATPDTSNPCSRFPCRATVRVDSVLGYGAAFVHPLPLGSEIVVTFIFTLHPTAEIFPAMKESFPGLSIGSVFLADIEGTEGMAVHEKSEFSFSIYGYKVIPTNHI